MIANRMAVDGSSWRDWFMQFNSGTYNNQWMILDWNKVSIGNKLEDNTLWVVEQIPGHINSSDVTDVLRKQGYWPSYNIPYFPFIYNMSQVPQGAKYGNLFDYENTPRAQIFRRDHPTIRTLEDMQNMMRYADFKRDPVSKCSTNGLACTPDYTSELTIATRGDLNPEDGVDGTSWPIPMLGRRNHVSSDAKITSHDLHWQDGSMKTSFISGPPANDEWDVPTFKWDQFYDKTVKHDGLPDEYNFKFETVEWKFNLSPSAIKP